MASTLVIDEASAADPRAPDASRTEELGAEPCISVHGRELRGERALHDGAVYGQRTQCEADETGVSQTVAVGVALVRIVLGGTVVRGTRILRETRIAEAVAVDVRARVTCIADPVEVEILLPGIRRVDAVVADVADPVSIGIRLVSVRRVGAIVGGVDHTIAVGVLRGGASRADQDNERYDSECIIKTACAAKRLDAHSILRRSNKPTGRRGTAGCP